MAHRISPSDQHADEVLQDQSFEEDVEDEEHHGAGWIGCSAIGGVAILIEWLTVLVTISRDD